jgi:hypothetical protein
MRAYAQNVLDKIAAAARLRFADAPPLDPWKPPRRTGHYIVIGAETLCLAEWSRRCGISRANLLGHKKRHGEAAMVRRIKLGLQGKYKLYERAR